MTSIFRRHSRGRPPHPDVLTPAEWRVLEEIREGRSNPEIAERLGLSRNTVKTHISSMLSKLDLRDREELAAWRGEPAVPSAGRSWLLAPLGWLTSKVAGGVAVAAVVAVVLGVVVVAMESGRATGGTSEPPSVASTPIVVPTEPRSEPTEPSIPATTSTPAPSQALFPQLDVGAPVDLPEDIALYVWDGCTSCDVSAVALRRFERSSATIDEEFLFARSINTPYILSAWIEEDALYVVECTTGFCGGLGPVAPDTTMTLYRSVDEGATWESLGALPVAEGDPLANPELADWGIPASEPPVLRTNEDGVFVVGETTLDLRSIDPRGTTQSQPTNYYQMGPINIDETGRIVMRWRVRVSPSQSIGYLTVFGPDGTPLTTYESHADASLAR